MARRLRWLLQYAVKREKGDYKQAWTHTGMEKARYKEKRQQTIGAAVALSNPEGEEKTRSLCLTVEQVVGKEGGNGQ